MMNLNNTIAHSMERMNRIMENNFTTGQGYANQVQSCNNTISQFNQMMVDSVKDFGNMFQMRGDEPWKW